MMGKVESLHHPSSPTVDCQCHCHSYPQSIFIEILLIFHIVLPKTPTIHIPGINNCDSDDQQVHQLVPALCMDLHL